MTNHHDLLSTTNISIPLSQLSDSQLSLLLSFPSLLLLCSNQCQYDSLLHTQISRRTKLFGFLLRIGLALFNFL